MEMGLDITAYRNATKVDLSPDEIDGDGYAKDWDNVTTVRDYRIRMHDDDFPGRSEGVSDGHFRFAEKIGFRAGSYSGYGQWRDWLARLAGYEPVHSGEGKHVPYANGAWQAESGPFWELINFSDCEGIIGPVVAKKLASDFAQYADKIGNAGWEPERYRLWQTAFEMAADNGFVEFH
jgi:hypothetical protein